MKPNSSGKDANHDNVDRLTPLGSWEFDSEVTAVFDDMLSRSIPQYEVMRQACFDVATRFVQPKTTIVDLGCSKGEAIAHLVDRFSENINDTQDS